MAPILTKLFQKSLETGQVPSDWKPVNVTSVFKKGDSSRAANYRPVSLFCVSSDVKYRNI